MSPDPADEPPRAQQNVENETPPAEGSRIDREPLLQNRDFKVLRSTQGASALGDAVSFTALPLLVLAHLGRAGLTALIPLSVALGGPTLAVILVRPLRGASLPAR